MNRIAMLALPYSRAELPGWGKLLKMLGVFEDGQWRDAPTRVLRDKFHGFEVNAHVSDWSDRLYYFTRRDYDLESCLLTMALLRDVEAFEEHVLRGFEQTLSTPRPAVVAEVLPSHLQRAGTTPEALLELMAKHGYFAYRFDANRAGLKHRLSAHDLAPGEAADARNV